MVDGHRGLNGRSIAAVAFTQIIAVETFRQIFAVKAAIGEQYLLSHDFCQLVLGCFHIELYIGTTMQLGVCNLVDGSRYRLRFAHTLLDCNALFGMGEEAIRAVMNGFDGDRDRGGTPESLHHDIIILHSSSKRAHDFRKGLAVRLRYIKYCRGTEMRNRFFDFLGKNSTVRCFQGQFGVRIIHDLLNLFLVRNGSNNGDTLFATIDMALELLLPFTIASNQRGIGALHIDQHLIVDRVTVKAGHHGQVLLVFTAGKQLLNAPFDVGCDFFQTFLCRFLGSFCGRRRRCFGQLISSNFRHNDLLSISGQKNKCPCWTEKRQEHYQAVSS